MMIRNSFRNVFVARLWVALLILLLAPTLIATKALSDDDGGAASRHIYPTYGVHNDPSYSPCKVPGCLYARGPGEPSNPIYPQHWSSDWIMYRVYNNYEKYPPPYNSPPANLVEGSDYEVSHGATYYDDTYRDENGTGAMMEIYDKRCLPIFPFSNHFTCAFISLGNKAYFLSYDDRPTGVPPCCRFSDQNHPPRRDFIKHLPYSKADSARLQDKVQGYSFRVGPGEVILFGYAFNSAYTPDSHDKTMAPYRHPHSFYFSGSPINPPDAPIVSQNYTNFSSMKPDPSTTWAQVVAQCKGNIPWCCLFAEDCPKNIQDTSMSVEAAPSWASRPQQ